MPRITVVTCDIPTCRKQIEIDEAKSPDIAVYQLLQVTDAMGKLVWFCSIEHLREWAQTYVSPYAEKEKSPVTEFFPEGLN